MKPVFVSLFLCLSVLANFAWASRRNVIMEGVGSGMMVLR